MLLEGMDVHVACVLLLRRAPPKPARSCQTSKHRRIAAAAAAREGAAAAPRRVAALGVAQEVFKRLGDCEQLCRFELAQDWECLAGDLEGVAAASGWGGGGGGRPDTRSGEVRGRVHGNWAWKEGGVRRYGEMWGDAAYLLGRMLHAVAIFFAVPTLSPVSIHT